MTIRESYKAMQQIVDDQRNGSRGWAARNHAEEVMQLLVERAQEHGWDYDGQWHVVRTRFHGGGVVSRHRTAHGAIAAALRIQHGDCVCGCAGAVPANAVLPGVETNDRNGYSPYTLTTR